MTHPIYSRQHLLNRGMAKVKSVAADLGVIPTGDKRELSTWVDAIIEHQSAQVQKVEAVIDFDGDSYEGLTEPYIVVVGGEVVHRTATYQMAERYCKWHNYTLVDTQEVAQQELDAELEEVQATEATAAITEESRISFISPSFGYYEAIVNRDVHPVIATIEYDDHGWNVKMRNKLKTLGSYEEAKQFIFDEYVKGVFMDERGSGRIEPVIEDMNIIIEDSNFVHDFGQSYTLRVHGALAGDIFLDDDHG